MRGFKVGETYFTVHTIQRHRTYARGRERSEWVRKPNAWPTRESAAAYCQARGISSVAIIQEEVSA